jgi:hypothetical protein
MGKNPDELTGSPATVILTGYAQLPAKASPGGVSGALSLEIEVNLHDMRIVDVAANCPPELGRKLLTDLLVGQLVEEGVNNAIREVRARYLSLAQRALIAVLEDVLRHYREFQKGKAG